MSEILAFTYLTMLKSWLSVMVTYLKEERKEEESFESIQTIQGRSFGPQ